MCFNYDDYYFVAHVTETDLLTAEATTQCCECGRKLPAGTRFEYVYQQENDENDWCPDEEGEEFDKGLWYEAWTCADCLLVREAVINSELDEGCARYEACPAYEMLFEEIRNGDSERYMKEIMKAGDKLTPEYLEWVLGDAYTEYCAKSLEKPE